MGRGRNADEQAFGESVGSRLSLDHGVGAPRIVNIDDTELSQSRVW
jgi:hypothetical protein